MVDTVDPVAVIGINPGRARNNGQRRWDAIFWYAFSDRLVWLVIKPYRLGGIVGGNTAKRFDHLGALILAHWVGIKCQC